MTKSSTQPKMRCSSTRLACRYTEVLAERAVSASSVTTATSMALGRRLARPPRIPAASQQAAASTMAI